MTSQSVIQYNTSKRIPILKTHFGMCLGNNIKQSNILSLGNNIVSNYPLLIILSYDEMRYQNKLCQRNWKVNKIY